MAVLSFRLKSNIFMKQKKQDNMNDLITFAAAKSTRQFGFGREEGGWRLSLTRAKMTLLPDYYYHRYYYYYYYCRCCCYYY